MCTVNNLIITDITPLGLTEIEKATLGWGAVNQLYASHWIISTPRMLRAGVMIGISLNDSLKEHYTAWSYLVNFPYQMVQKRDFFF